MLRCELAAALRCSYVPADGFAASLLCRRRGRRFFPLTLPAAGAALGHGFPECAAGCRTPQPVLLLFPASAAAAVSVPVYTTAYRSPANPPATARCDIPCPPRPLPAPAHSFAPPPPLPSPPLPS